jgi:hypothetical protein
MMRASVLALAAVLVLAQPRVAVGGAVVFASDQGYFAGASAHASGATRAFPSETYETLDRTTLDGIVRGLLGADGVSSLDARPAWVNAEALTRTRPSVVLLGAGRKISPADLADADLAASIRRAGAELVAPNARAGSREGDGEAIVMSALRTHGEGRRFVVGECGDAYAGATRLDGDAVRGYVAARRARLEKTGETEIELVAVCDLDVFADLASSLRAESVPHAAVFFGEGATGEADATSECVERARDAARSEKAKLGDFRRRALLLSENPTEACDDLCQLQTNVLTGLLFFTTVALTIMFGYALMHNLDSPTRFEKSKEEEGR